VRNLAFTFCVPAFFRPLLAAELDTMGQLCLCNTKTSCFFSGDGGYGAHFKEIGRNFGGFDLAIMENGQYDAHWHRIHLLPKETAQATEDVGAKLVIPAHSGKFALARHAWDAPYRVFVDASRNKRYEIITPEIGELAYIGTAGQNFGHWWERMR